MKQISKAEFIRTITSGKSLFIGISPTMDEIEIKAARERVKERHISNYRTCEAKANQVLVFSNDSYLRLADVKPHTFIKCYEDNGILVVENKWLDIDWQGNLDATVYKYLYYTMA